jgi:hypothetical protein
VLTRFPGAQIVDVRGKGEAPDAAAEILGPADAEAARETESDDL